jgi:hypothetical protein
VAKEEIWRRWNDKKLRKKVEDFLGEAPEPIKKYPRSIIARHIIRPDNEYLYFLDIVKMSDLKPLGWEYLRDKFYTVNQNKLCLGKMHCCDPNDFSEGNISIRKIVDFKDKCEGKPFCDINTVWGENIIDFYHRLPELIGVGRIEAYDASCWYKARGKNAKENYKYFLAIFVVNGILFENFLSNNGEEQFTKNVVLPAYREIVKTFGLRPLIVPLISRKVESDLFWGSYPTSVQKIVDRLINTK